MQRRHSAIVKGRLLSMRAEPEPHGPLHYRARYTAVLDCGEFDLGEAVGCGLTLRLLGGARCRHCDQVLRRPYGGGYCYDCFSTLARCDLCIVSPDRCHYHLGTCREPEWGDAFCMQPHWVYLSLTSGPKVGITRGERVLERWLDQGASRGLKLAWAPSRRAAGALEASLKRSVSDRTDWRRMVSGLTTSVDLLLLAAQLRRDTDLAALSASDNVTVAEVESMAWVDEVAEVRLDYPVRSHSPATRLPLDAQNPTVADNLCGIMGQYLMLSRGVVNTADLIPLGIELEVGPRHRRDSDDDEQMSLFA